MVVPDLTPSAVTREDGRRSPIERRAAEDIEALSHAPDLVAQVVLLIRPADVVYGLAGAQLNGGATGRRAPNHVETTCGLD